MSLLNEIAFICCLIVSQNFLPRPSAVAWLHGCVMDGVVILGALRRESGSPVCLYVFVACLGIFFHFAVAPPLGQHFVSCGRLCPVSARVGVFPCSLLLIPD